jgi:hypothetical protein
MMNHITHYQKRYINRRSKRALMLHQERQYYYYFRNSWDRFCRRKKALDATIVTLSEDDLKI